MFEILTIRSKVNEQITFLVNRFLKDYSLQKHPTSCNSASLRWRTMNLPPISIASPVVLVPDLGGIVEILLKLFFL